MSQFAARKRTALRLFKQRGFVVQVGALERVLSGFENLKGALDSDGGFPVYVARVLEAFDQGLASGERCDGSQTVSMFSATSASRAVEQVSEAVHCRAGQHGEALQVIDIFSVPLPAQAQKTQQHGSPASDRFHFSRNGCVLDAKPLAKGSMFRMRYNLLLEKTLRNEKFAPPASSLIRPGGISKACRGSPYLQLTSIDSLKGSLGDRIVLGMLTQLEEGSWFLEDIHGSIEVDLSEVETTAGLHTDSSFVIAQGRIIEVGDVAMNACCAEKAVDIQNAANSRCIFKVSAMGPPPFEDRDMSHQVLGKAADTFGGQRSTEAEKSLFEFEQNTADAVFVMLSDVFLDSPRVMAGLRLIFEGYLNDGVVPTAVILIGSFLSHPFGQDPNDPSVLSAGFANLGELIMSEFPVLAESCTFVLVAGPTDAGPGNILPRPAMPKMLAKGFVDALPPGRVLLGTNPCRMRYMTQEIVVLREDLLHKMIRKCAVKPSHSDTSIMAEHMFKSIVDQCHLCPLPTSSRPTLWAHDHALWLFPTPHLVVVADSGDSFSFLYGNENGNTGEETDHSLRKAKVTGVNPGSFGSDLSFSLYYPAERRAEACSVDPSELSQDISNTCDRSDSDSTQAGGDDGAKAYSSVIRNKTNGDIVVQDYLDVADHAEEGKIVLA